MAQNDEIAIGEWCLFEIEYGLFLGLILSFCYTSGTTLKARAYTKSAAQITNIMPVGVLGTWYSWGADGILKKEHKSMQTFVNISNYKGTIPKPKYSQKELIVNKTVLKTLNDYKASNEIDMG